MNIDNSGMDMDPEVAKMLFNQGAILFITGLPIGTQFGIDLCTYTSGERFRGIKMIPAGPHFVFCASQGPYGDSGPRVGFIYYFKPYEIVVREWDSHVEELRERTISDPELEKRQIRENIKNLDSFLGPYDYRYINNWRNLADTISAETICRCNPECGVIRTDVELQSCSDKDRPRGNPSLSKPLLKIVTEDDLLPKLKPIPGTALRLTPVPDRFPKNASPSEITKHHMDCFHSIKELMEKFSKPSDLIEEIQLAFVLFFIGYSVEGLAHWRKCLNLLCNSELSVVKYKLFYMKYLEVLMHQLPNLPEELMEPNQFNTVYKDVRRLLSNSVLGGLKVSCEKVMNKLEINMSWRFYDLLEEDPEDLPVIVDDIN